MTASIGGQCLRADMQTRPDMQTTQDAFLGGRLRLHQPAEGYRAGQDPVLLAAATPIRPGQDFVDIGCGVGTLGLSLFARLGRSAIQGMGVEQDADLASLARANAQENDVQAYEICQGDVFTLLPQPKAWVLSNPPFFASGTGRVPSHAQRLRGRHGDVPIAAWVQQMKSWVRPRGYMGLILNTPQVQDVMAALRPDFGGLTLVPLLGNKTKPIAERCLLFARQGSRSPFQLAAPLIIRGDGGDLTPQAQGILGQGAAWNLPKIK